MGGVLTDHLWGVPRHLVSMPLDKYPDLWARYNAGEIFFSNGVYRVASGLPAAGSIVAHSRQVSEVAQQMSSQLHALTGLTYVSAGASLVTLGVSVAGFAIMNHRLKKLQASVDLVQQAVAQGFNSTRRAMAGLEERLVFAATLLSEDLSQLRQDLARLRDELRDRELARLQGVADRLAGLRGLSREDAREVLQSAEQTLSEVLPWLERRACDSLRTGASPADAVLFAQWLAVGVALEGAVRYVRHSPADAAVRVSQRLRTLRPHVDRACVRVLPLHALPAATATTLREELGRSAVAPLQSARAVAAEVRMPSAFPAAIVRERGFVAVALTQSVERLEALADEWLRGDPQLAHPFVEWRRSANAGAANEPVLVLPVKAG